MIVLGLFSAIYTHSDSFTRHHSIVGMGGTRAYKLFVAHKTYAMRITRSIAMPPSWIQFGVRPLLKLNIIINTYTD